MVKIGILDADDPLGGELVRILVNHPEVEIDSLYAPLLMGRSVASFHHGLIGETPLNFSDKLNPEELDLLVILNNNEMSSRILSRIDNWEGLKVIAKDKEAFSGFSNEVEKGLSEINRKALVRGARFSHILSPAIVPALIVLSPLGDYMLLNSDIEIEVSLPQDMIQNSNIDSLNEELKELLKQRQPSFSGDVSLKIVPSSSLRGAETFIRINNSLPLEEIEKIYDSLYDDHNFTFLSRTEVGTSEVEGTQKVVLTLEKPDPEHLTIHAVSDARMRGGAGDIVHVLNLFFGLHEKTGLSLKSSVF